MNPLIEISRLNPLPEARKLPRGPYLHVRMSTNEPVEGLALC